MKNERVYLQKFAKKHKIPYGILLYRLNKGMTLKETISFIDKKPFLPFFLVKLKFKGKGKNNVERKIIFSGRSSQCWYELIEAANEAVKNNESAVFEILKPFVDHCSAIYRLRVNSIEKRGKVSMNRIEH